MSDAAYGFKCEAGVQPEYGITDAPLAETGTWGEPTPQAKHLNTACFYVPWLNTCPSDERRVSSAAGGVPQLGDTMDTPHITSEDGRIGIGTHTPKMTAVRPGVMV